MTGTDVDELIEKGVPEGFSTRSRIECMELVGLMANNRDWNLTDLADALGTKTQSRRFRDCLDECCERGLIRRVRSGRSGYEVTDKGFEVID